MCFCVLFWVHFKLADAICISSALHRQEEKRKSIAHSMVVHCACVINPRKHVACNEVLPRAPQMCVQGLSGSTITLVACSLVPRPHQKIGKGPGSTSVQLLSTMPHKFKRSQSDFRTKPHANVISSHETKC